MYLSYSQNLVSVGEHIKKKRMDLKMLQNDFARILGVSTDCVTCWENAKTASAPYLNTSQRIQLVILSNFDQR